MKHTKEPWTVINTEEENSWSSRIVSRVQTYGERISPAHPWKDEPMVVVDDWAVDEIDARRIVACVNACAGVPNEDLLKVVAFGKEHVERMIAEYEHGMNMYDANGMP